MKASQETGLSKLREDSRGIEAAEVFSTHSPETRRGAALEEDHWKGPFPVWNGPFYYLRRTVRRCALVSSGSPGRPGRILPAITPREG